MEAPVSPLMRSAQTGHCAGALRQLFSSQTAAAAAAVRRGVEHFPRPVTRLLVTGGGRHNPVLMKMIAEGAGCAAAPVETVGLDGDMLEAQAFAFLAVRVARGFSTSCPGTTGVGAAVGGGQISQPN